jgi:hypothetical protein
MTTNLCIILRRHNTVNQPISPSGCVPSTESESPPHAVSFRPFRRLWFCFGAVGDVPQRNHYPVDLALPPNVLPMSLAQQAGIYIGTNTGFWKVYAVLVMRETRNDKTQTETSWFLGLCFTNPYTCLIA